ncbi:MAG: hypothetical protein KF696_00685 [Planctomycetes bacterium]|nr:hypothetical protein [Planctomycetota bacterium]MCW8134546.1 hypothetical protein [Planctomycetota bacterium]
MRSASACFPALLAVFVLAILPSCAMYRPAVQQAGPIERPHIMKRVAPRDPDAARIVRVAGEALDEDSAAALGTAIWLALIALGWILIYGIGWLIAKTVEAISEGLATVQEPGSVPAVVDAGASSHVRR